MEEGVSASETCENTVTGGGSVAEVTASTQEVLIVEGAVEAREEDDVAMEIEDTRPVCASLDGRGRRHLLRRPDELLVPSQHCIVPIMEDCQLRTDRPSVDSLEKDPPSDRDSYPRSRGNSKSEDSVSSDSSSGFRSGGYVSEDEPPPEYSKVVTVHYSGDEAV